MAFLISNAVSRAPTDVNVPPGNFRNGMMICAGSMSISLSEDSSEDIGSVEFMLDNGLLFEDLMNQCNLAKKSGKSCFGEATYGSFVCAT
jgi:hypothetical protein